MNGMRIYILMNDMRIIKLWMVWEHIYLWNIYIYIYCIYFCFVFENSEIYIIKTKRCALIHWSFCVLNEIHTCLIWGVNNGNTDG